MLNKYINLAILYSYISLILSILVDLNNGSVWSLYFEPVIKRIAFFWEVCNLFTCYVYEAPKSVIP